MGLEFEIKLTINVLHVHFEFEIHINIIDCSKHLIYSKQVNHTFQNVRKMVKWLNSSFRNSLNFWDAC